MLTATRAASSIPYGGRDVRRVAAERLVHRQRRSNGALGVVAVRDRRAEQRQQAVAGQLRDRAVEATHLLGQQADDLVEEELRALRAELLGDRRRVDEIGDQHRDDAPLALAGHERDRDTAQWRRARA